MDIEISTLFGKHVCSIEFEHYIDVKKIKECIQTSAAKKGLDYPPSDIELFQSTKKCKDDDFFLVTSALLMTVRPSCSKNHISPKGRCITRRCMFDDKLTLTQ